MYYQVNKIGKQQQILTFSSEKLAEFSRTSPPVIIVIPRR